MNTIILNFASKIKSAKEEKTLNKPFELPAGSSKKFGVYVKNEAGQTVMKKFNNVKAVKDWDGSTLSKKDQLCAEDPSLEDVTEMEEEEEEEDDKEEEEN